MLSYVTRTGVHITSCCHHVLGRNTRMKILEQRIPNSYGALRDRIKELADENIVTIMKDNFL